MKKCDGFPEAGCDKEVNHRIYGYDLCDGCAQAFVFGSVDEKAVLTDALKSIETLKEILTDPVNQLEVTKGGYYIYRFDLETMHQIADAIGIPKNKAGDVLVSYKPEELPLLIRPS